MKKIIATIISLIFVISSCTNVFAMKTIPAYFQIYDSEDKKEIERQEINVNGITYKVHFFKFDGETYIYDGNNPRKYNEELDSKFIEDYVITDNGYIQKILFMLIIL